MPRLTREGGIGPLAEVPKRSGRILLVTPQPFFEERGTPIALLMVLRALCELGHEVDVIAFPMGETIELPGVRYFRTANPFGYAHMPVGFSFKKAVLDGFLLRELVARLRAESYDAIHAVEEAAYIAALIAPRFGVPVLYDMASSIPEQLIARLPFRLPPFPRVMRSIERRHLRRVSGVLCSVGLRERVMEEAPETRVREWHYPGMECALPASEIDALRTELGISSSQTILCYAGTFEPYQGLPELLSALPVVLRRRPEAVAVLVGASSEAARAEAEASLPDDVRKQVRLMLRQPRARIEAFLMLADVLISPRSHGGNLPLKIFDYLAAGKTIVATDIAAHRAVLDDTRAILVPQTAEGLASGLLEALEDPAHAQAVASEGRTFYEREYGWQHFVDEIAAAYEAAISHSHRERR